MIEYIKMDDLEHGRIYRLKSRNLTVGIWDENSKGFIGIREKFGSRYLFTEYHRDHDPYVGTAAPVEDLGRLSEPVEVVEASRNDASHLPVWEENLKLFRILEAIEEGL